MVSEVRRAPLNEGLEVPRLRQAGALDVLRKALRRARLNVESKRHFSFARAFLLDHRGSILQYACNVQARQYDNAINHLPDGFDLGYSTGYNPIETAAFSASHAAQSTPAPTRRGG